MIREASAGMFVRIPHGVAHTLRQYGVQVPMLEDRWTRGKRERSPE